MPELDDLQALVAKFYPGKMPVGGVAGFLSERRRESLAELKKFEGDTRTDIENHTLALLTSIREAQDEQGERLRRIEAMLQGRSGVV